MPLQKIKHVYVYTQYRKHQHDYKNKTKNREAQISENAKIDCCHMIKNKSMKFVYFKF